MDKKKIKTILKSVAIVLILFAFVFVLRAQAADLSAVPNELKSTYTDSSGLPYFSEMDSYFNLRMTQDYMDHGYFGDTLVNGSGWDMHSYYPSGRDVGSYQPMIAYVTSTLYDVVNMFHSMSIKEVAFWTGAFISSFAVIPAYVFVRRITNDYGAIAASLIVCLGPNYFSHTFAGFFDTDMFNVTLPLFFILFFIECVKSEKLSHRFIFGLLSIGSLGVYSLSWTGFMFYPAIMVLAMILFFILCFYLKIRVVEPADTYSNRVQWFINQKEIFSIVFMVIVGAIGLFAAVGFDGIMNGIVGLTGGLSLQAATSSNVWPNVLVSVAEMQIPNLVSGGLTGSFLANTNGVINGVGGIVAFFGALIVLFTFVQRLWRLKSVRVKGSYKKPPKDKRKATALRKEEDRFHLALKDVGSFGSTDEINQSKRQTVLYLSVLFVWIIASAIAVTKGTRFIQVLVIPMGICAGIFVGYAVDYVKAKVDKDRTLMILAVICSALVSFPITQLGSNVLPNCISYGMILFVGLCIISAIAIYGIKSLKDSDVSIKKSVVVILIVLALISPTVCSAYQTSQQVVPGTSDPMANTMDFIKTNTSNDTVIFSWWDFGYFFESASGHPTSFDGGSQTGDRAFWVGRALSTSNLDLSKGIMQMLATTGDNATNLLANYTGDNVTAANALLEILPMSKDDAKNTLVNSHHLSDTQATNVVSQSHPDNPNNVAFVASSDMLQKAGWWSYFGMWNFDIKNSTNYNYFVSSEQTHIGANSNGSTVLSDSNGIQAKAVINRGAGNNSTTAKVDCVFSNNGTPVIVNNTTYNPFKASNVMIIEDNYLMKNESLNNNGNYTLFLLGNNGTYSSILIDNHLKDSTFTKLFLLGGAGQDTFTMTHMENGVSLWEINPNATSNSTANVANSTDNTTDNVTGNITANNTNNSG